MAERLIHPKAKVTIDELYDDWFCEMRDALTAWERHITEEIGAVMAERFRVAV